MPLFCSDIIERLGEIYPLSPAVFQHELIDEPLLTIAALSETAGRLPTAHVERRVSDAARGDGFRLIHPQDDQPKRDDQPDLYDHWTMLRCIEQLPDYRDLLFRLIREIEPVVGNRTGPAENVKGFVFISPPDARTPFHFDAEYNILFQISGRKTFTTCPPQPPFLDLGRREAYHQSGENLLDWDENFKEIALEHRLAPGDAIYVPYAAPHWVHVGTEPSISLSLTWQSAWSANASHALALNSLLRRLGFKGRDVPSWPETSKFRGIAGRAARRLRLV